MASGQIPFGHDGFGSKAASISKSLSYEQIGENTSYVGFGVDLAATTVEKWLSSPGRSARLLFRKKKDLETKTG
ncbi:hypothetical protein ACFLRM_02995 [Acidobacteriota bacterium]